MCGIFGITGSNGDTIQTLLKGLTKVEYRGYDSSGICISTPTGLSLKRKEGMLDNLKQNLSGLQEGRSGIAHTRWATHGPPTEMNAHPHCDPQNRVAVVHNGIIENEVQLRQILIESGSEVCFSSDTDSELVAHVFAEELDAECGDEVPTDEQLLASWRRTLDRLNGSFSLGVLVSGRDDVILFARVFSPLILALDEEAGYLASDISSLAGMVDKISYLEDGDWGLLHPDRIELYDKDGEKQIREMKKLPWAEEDAELGGWSTFMLKEINEQPAVIRACLHGRLSRDAVRGVKISFKPDLVRIIACGTAFHAGMMARHYIEELSGIPCIVDHAHEFRYGTPSGPKALVLGISQSGETADTLAGLMAAQERGYPTLSIVNVETSTIARQSDAILGIRAGPEIGVASTKAFTGQVLGGLLVGLRLGRLANKVHTEDLTNLNNAARRLPNAMERLLASDQLEQGLKRARRLFKGKEHAFYLGRNSSYPIALEGALKLKEISYIHAEGYAGGELKHGPLALIEEGTPVVVVSSDGIIQQKLFGNAREVAARGARVIMIAIEGDQEAAAHADVVIYVPKTHKLLQPLMHNVVCQLLSYHVARDRDCNVDRPRNLAKSVTVE
jgi:glucosamine--fructose-6-phosphate aminotransferase (isomerizing)